MKNKKIATLIFAFVILGVFYFVYRAFISDSMPNSQIDQQVQQLDQMQNTGVKEFSGNTIDNQPFQFSSVKNKIVILNFWASWCGPCVEEFPSLIKMVQDAKGDVGLIAVSLDSDEAQMRDFLKSYDVANANIHLLKDPQYQLAQGFGTYKLPESYILNSDRKLVKKISGAIDWTSGEITSFLKPILESDKK